MTVAGQPRAVPWLGLVSLHLLIADVAVLAHAAARAAWLAVFFWPAGSALCKVAPCLDWSWWKQGLGQAMMWGAVFGYQLWGLVVAVASLDVAYSLHFPLLARQQGSQRYRISHFT